VTLVIRLVLLGAAVVGCGSGALAQQTPIERGSYLVNNIGACGNCHTPREKGVPDLTKRFSGGFQTFSEPWFLLKGSNITPDPETGIGQWSVDDLKRALIEGVRPNGVPLAPIMPFPFFKVLTTADLDAMVAYLRSVLAIRNPVQPPVYKAASPKEEVPGASRPMTEEELRDPVKRGFYLASLAHCMACHSRRSEHEPPDFKGAWGAGGRIFRGGFGESVAANISGHQTKGLGAWSDAEIRRALTEGVARDGRKLKPPMIDYVAYYKTWTESDITALIAWMRTIPPIE
jgi:mono/diheme cytochrome c family protein